jgi:hypothetical protein
LGKFGGCQLKSSIENKIEFLTKHFGNIYRNSEHNLVFSNDGKLPNTHMFAQQVQAFLETEAITLPYPLYNDAIYAWLTFAENPNDFKKKIVDIRSWIIPNYGWEDKHSLVTKSAREGNFQQEILQFSPHGYYRWFSKMSDGLNILRKLNKAQYLNSKVPERSSSIELGIVALRREFAMSLANSYWEKASSIIAEIDKRQLDTAANSNALRIQLLYTTEDYRGIVEFPNLENLITVRPPRKIKEAILVAHHCVYLEELEEQKLFDQALDQYAKFHGILAGLASSISTDDSRILKLKFYDCITSETKAHIELPQNFVGDDALTWLRDLFDNTGDTDEVSTNEDSNPQGQVVAPRITSNLDWSNLHGAVKNNEFSKVRTFLHEVENAPFDWVPADVDFLTEVFTDPEISDDIAKQVLGEEILISVVDNFIAEPLFPRTPLMSLYKEILGVWVDYHSGSTKPNTSEFVLTLCEAILELDARELPAIKKIIEDWWGGGAESYRRLAWLAEAVTLLIEKDRNTEIETLWIAGANLISNSKSMISSEDQIMWRSLGGFTTLDAETVDELLDFEEKEIDEETDILAECDFTKVSIVTLNERTAKIAKREIETRTHAKVIIVSDLSAGEGTDSALLSDVVLFVSGAVKHAVYRAFDGKRDILEYVQGKGSSSIVRALERRVRNLTV